MIKWDLITYIPLRFEMLDLDKDLTQKKILKVSYLWVSLEMLEDFDKVKIHHYLSVQIFVQLSSNNALVCPPSLLCYFVVTRWNGKIKVFKSLAKLMKR